MSYVVAFSISIKEIGIIVYTDFLQKFKFVKKTKSLSVHHCKRKIYLLHILHNYSNGFYPNYNNSTHIILSTHFSCIMFNPLD